jgi:hypothetical protein
MRIVNTIEKTSVSLGQMMGAAVDRKVKIDEKYMSEAQKFGNQLKARNAVAAKSFRRARRAKIKAA